MRLVGAALLFAIMQRSLTPLLKMRLKDMVLLIACSMLGIVGNQFLFVKALALTTVINAEILSTTIPVYALVVSILLRLRAWIVEDVDRRRIVGGRRSLPHKSAARTTSREAQPPATC